MSSKIGMMLMDGNEHHSERQKEKKKKKKEFLSFWILFDSFVNPKRFWFEY